MSVLNLQSSNNREKLSEELERIFKLLVQALKKV